jgi:uncharacterized small protein (DUF1192 family)
MLIFDQEFIENVAGIYAELRELSLISLAEFSEMIGLLYSAETYY